MPGWTQPDSVQLLNVPDNGLQPQAAVDADGTLHLVYFKGEPRSGNLFYARRDPTAQDFNEPIRVNHQANTAVAIGTVRGGHMALGKNGRVHVAWMSADAEQSGMFYARLNSAGTAFEPQRNVTHKAHGLDGGGSIAADGQGHVYVSWHAGESGEAERQVWLAHSADGGTTFAPERRANPSDTGACGCCGMQAGTDAQGNLYMLYRAATEQVHRDIYLLLSQDQGATFRDTLAHAWELNSCPMSTAALRATSDGILAAWEKAGQVYFSQMLSGPLALSPPIPAPGEGKNRKHPAVAGNKAGETLLVWAEGTGWAQGGALAWQVYTADGQPTTTRGRLPDAIPVWSRATAVVLADGRFAVVY